MDRVLTYDRGLERFNPLARVMTYDDFDKGFNGWMDLTPNFVYDDYESFESYVERFGTPDWQGDPHVDVFPGGETTAQFHLRVGAALSRLVSANAGSTIVIVCHGGVIDAVFRQLLRVPATGAFELQTANTSLTEFVEVPGAGAARWRLVRYNDAAHLAGLPAATPRR